MNVETGELISDERFKELMQKEKEAAAAFKPVPDELEEEAKKELGNKDRVFVDMKKKTPLTKWAHQERRAIHKVNKRKAHRKIAEASKRRNRK